MYLIFAYQLKIHEFHCVLLFLQLHIFIFTIFQQFEKPAICLSDECDSVHCMPMWQRHTYVTCQCWSIRALTFFYSSLCSGFSLEHRTVPFTMASVLTRLTVKTSALVTPRPRLTICKLVSRNASANSASKFQINNQRRVLTLVGGSIVSIAALGAFIKFRSTANKANAMRKKSLVN